MSLKDRLNSNTKINPEIKELKEQPRYYSSNEEAAIDSLGPIDALFADDEINSIIVSGAKNIYVDKKGKITKSTINYRDNVQLENIIKKTAQNYGIELDTSNPQFEFNFKEGINIVATIPPLSNVSTLFIKCYKDKFATMQYLQEEQSLSKEIALTLEALSLQKLNILIIGEKNTLKTTLLSAIAKKLPSNNRGVVVDFSNEFTIEKTNYTNYNLSCINNKKTILKTIINSNPDKIYINDADDKSLNYIFKNLNNYKGINLTLNSNGIENALTKIAKIISKYENTPFEIALKETYSLFDVIILTEKNDNRIVSKIAQINEEKIENIFEMLNLKEHKSTGIIPKCFNNIDLPVSTSVFEIGYKHTYQNNPRHDVLQSFAKRNSNIDILKKFKKDLTQETSKEEKKFEVIENIEPAEHILDEEELSAKIQEKFDALKKNASIENLIEKSEIDNVLNNQNE